MTETEFAQSMMASALEAAAQVLRERPLALLHAHRAGEDCPYHLRHAIAAMLIFNVHAKSLHEAGFMGDLTYAGADCLMSMLVNQEASGAVA
jgi:hypothetical protein